MKRKEEPEEQALPNPEENWIWYDNARDERHFC